MLLALLALAAGGNPQTATLTLSADAYLDRKAPDTNTGREPLLHGGIDKVILVRFPDLGLTIGMGKKVRSAKLIMGVGRPGEPKLATISRVIRPWAEGGNTSESAKATPGAVTWAEAISGKDGLKWERDGASGGNDAQAISGAQTAFADDRLTINGLEAAVQELVDNPQENYGFRLAFSNAVAFFSSDSLADGPQLVVTFEDAPAGSGVDLQVLMCEPDSTGAHWTATVRNAGDAASSQQTLSVTQPGKDPIEQRQSTSIDPGGTKTFTFDVSGVSAQGRSVVVRVAPSEKDKNSSDNGIVLYPSGLAVAVPGADLYKAQQVVTDLNERVFPFSKFGAWPTGCVERLRLAQNNATVTAKNGDDLHRSIIRAITGLPDNLLRPFADQPPTVAGVRASGFVGDLGQVGLLPDTRDDVLIPRDLPIPDRAAVAGAFGEIPMNEWGMLSRSEVTIINSQIGKPRALPWEMTPTMLFFRVFTPDGMPPAGAKLEVYQLVGGAFGSQPVFTSDIGRDGSALMEPRAAPTFGKANPFGDLNKDGSNGWLLAVVRYNDSVQSSWIPIWQLWDEYARGNQSIAFIELKVKLASGPLDTTQNLALGAFVSDAKGRFPAELNALVDGKNDTSLAVANEEERYWIDLDLGRDRQIGQIQLVFEGPVWKQFRILTYKTAQNVGDAQVWSEEANGPANSDATKTDDGKTVLSYSSRSVRSRFIRIIPLSREAVKLSEVRAIPIRTD